jgi:hypothetical protein
VGIPKSGPIRPGQPPNVKTSPGPSSKDGASPAETRWGTVFCSPAGYGCSRLTATSCAQYAPKSVGVIVAAVLSGPVVGGLIVAERQLCVAELTRS